MGRLIGLADAASKPLELFMVAANPWAWTPYERRGFIVMEPTEDTIRMRRSVNLPQVGLLAFFSPASPGLINVRWVGSR